MKLPIYQVDAFTSRVFGGNPAAVVPLAAWLPDATMQAVAAENNLAETAFFVPIAEFSADPSLDAAIQRRRSDEFEHGEPLDAHFRLRWFTPAVEVELCGHATLAAAHVLWRHLGYTRDVVRFASAGGPLAVTREVDRLVLDFPSRPGRAQPIPSALSAALGAAPRELYAARDWMAVYGSEAEVCALRPSPEQVAALDTFAVIATAPGDDCDFVSRFFAPRAGIPEDPVTGSAHCMLIPYWAARLRRPDLHARQVSSRVGELFCRDNGARVDIGGHAVTYLEGAIHI